MRDLAFKCLNIKINVPFTIGVDMEKGLYGSTVVAEDEEDKMNVRYVEINIDQCMNNMIKTIFHETRHIYQYQTYQRYMLLRHRKNIGRTKQRTFRQYWMQPIEIGARLYARYAMKRYKRQIDNIVQQYKDKVLDLKLY
jgi:hypothetical protein